jgi:tripartite-type tricarboxylate transporter receptor subunit TctC
MRLLFLLFLIFPIAAQSTELRLIVPYAPGGPADLISRAVQSNLNSQNIPTVIEYKTGAGGAIAFNYIAKLKTNETVIALASNGLTDGPIIDKKETYDLGKDFILVKHLGIIPNLLVVSNKVTANTLLELVEQAKSNPVYYGSSGVGSGQHILAALITAKFNNFVHVPYKGGSEALADLLGNHIQFVVESNMLVDPYIRSNLLKPLAVLNSTRLADYPAVSTVKEYGINDYNYERWFALVANSTADPAILNEVQTKLMSLDLKSLGILPTSLSIDNFLVNQQQQFRQIAKDVNFERN